MDEKVVSIFDKKVKKTEEVVEEGVDQIKAQMEWNFTNNERIAKERAQKNKVLISNYKLAKKKKK